MNLPGLRRGPTATPAVAFQMLYGDPSTARDAAREAYMRTASDEELFEWFRLSIRALLLRHPKHGALVVDMAQEAGREFGVSQEQLDVLRGV